MAKVKFLSKAPLVKAAEELNEVLGLEPQIDVNLEVDDLIRDILDAAELLVPEDDISEETLNVINSLETAQESGQEAAAEVDVTDAESTDNGTEGEESAPASEDIGKQDTHTHKNEKTAEKAAKEKKVARDYSKSNKAIVYLAWKQDGIEDVVELGALVENRVKNTTIKSWISQWKKGKNLPAIAK